MARASLFLALLLAAVLSGGCAYRPYATDLRPLAETEQAQGSSVEDDGTVTFYQGRLEVSLRPVSDEELNRQFASYSAAGAHSTNPYTYGNSKVGWFGATPRRFTVFMLSIKNYQFPKVQLGGDIVLTAQNGRKYYALTKEQLDVYYRAYAIAYAGIEYNEYQNRRDLLSRTTYPRTEPVFSGQEAQGYILFEPLADDVHDITVRIEDLITRFDYSGNPVESVSASYRFRRDIGRILPDGRVQLTSN